MEQNSLTVVEIDRLTTEILILKQQTAQNLIEIGKRLVEVKKGLPHGEWGNWLKEKVDFTDRTAQRFMKVANEFSNTTTLSDLPKSKVFALLDLPAEEREQFAKDNDIAKMSTRELQKAVKERDKALKEKEDLELKLKTAEEQAQKDKLHYDNLSKSYDHLEKTNTKHYEKAHKLESELAETNKQLSEAQASGDNEEIGRLSELLAKTENELADSSSKIKELERQLKAKPIETTATQIVEKIPDEVEKELAELRKGLQLTKFKVYFDDLVKGFQALLGALAEITDLDERERYKKAVAGLIGKMSERL